MKFTDKYCIDAHNVLATAGFAPKLLYSEYVTKRFMMVVMEEVQDAVFLTEYLTQHSNERTKVLTKCTNALNKLHESDFCQGDFRPNNILVQNIGEVYVIDFHWDRKSNEACYPLFMNHENISWTPLAADGLPLQEEHDFHWIQQLEHILYNY